MRSRELFSALMLAGILAQPTLASAQDNTPSVTTRTDRDDNDQWGWLGLIGLAGLLGLRRRDHVETRVNPRTVP